MKYSLVLEKNAVCADATSRLLASLGYVTVPVFDTEKALHAAYVIKFDVVVTHTVVKPGDRRSFASELRRFAPDTTMVLLVDEDADACGGASCDGVSTILQRPVTARNLRSTIEFGLDGCGLQPAPATVPEERRRRSGDRRCQARQRPLPQAPAPQSGAPDACPVQNKIRRA